MIKSVSYKSDKPVQNGLALTPTDIDRLTFQGRAAALGSLEGAEMYTDLPNGAAVPMDKMRGKSINDLWRESRNARKRIMDAKTKMDLAQVQEQRLN